MGRETERSHQHRLSRLQPYQPFDGPRKRSLIEDDFGTTKIIKRQSFSSFKTSRP